MEHEGEKESGEMFTPNESGEYTLHNDTASFTVQGLRDALNAAESIVTELPCPTDEFIIQLEVMMADQPRRPCPPAFSWNGGMVQHVLKSDPALRELEHVQVDSPGLAYLFFYDRHGHCGLTKEAALAIQLYHHIFLLDLLILLPLGELQNNTCQTHDLPAPVVASGQGQFD